MNPFSLIPAPYQLIAKGIAALVLLLALWYTWHSFTGHLIDTGKKIGRAEVQADWDKETGALEVKHAQEVAHARDIERGKWEAVHKIDTDNLQKAEDEKSQLEASLATSRATPHSMRIIRGEAVTTDSNGVPSASATVSGIAQTCEARLPATIGAAFERLREGALRVGSKANEAAITLGSVQAAAGVK